MAPDTDSDAFALMAAATGSVPAASPVPNLRAGQPAQPAPRGRRSLIGLIVGLAGGTIIVAGGIVVLALDPFGFFPETVPTAYSNEVEQALAASIGTSGGMTVPVESVACPEDLAVDFAGEFSCDVALGDGSTLRVIAQISDNGRTVQWSPGEAS